MVNLRAPGEAMIDFPTADREGLRVGSVVRFIVGDPNARSSRLAAVRIVGIVASPGQFPAVGASASGSVYVTPAFVASNGIRPSPGDAGLLIRLRHGAADRAAFVRDKAAAGLGSVDIPQVQQVQTAGIQRSIRLESQALWALCVLIGLAAFAVVGQSLARQTYLDSADLPALWALGFSRAQLLSLGVPGRVGVRGGRGWPLRCGRRRPGRIPAVWTPPPRGYRGRLKPAGSHACGTWKPRSVRATCTGPMKEMVQLPFMRRSRPRPVG
jgi:hypothetical protein